MKIGENTEFKLELKTIISIIVLTSTFMGMYYTLQGEIEEAKKMPPAEIAVSYTHLTLPTKA